MKLTKHVVKGTGVELTIRKVSPMLTQQIIRDFPEPEAPTQEVEINGVTVVEENKEHPEYLRALQKYNIELNEKINKLMVKLGVVINLNDKMKEEVQVIREAYEEINGKELRFNDEYVYINFVALGTQEDYQELVRAIYKVSDVNEEDMKAAETSFQGEV